MSFADTASLNPTDAIDSLLHRLGHLDRISPKRKFDDYAEESDLTSVRMKTDDSDPAVNSSSLDFNRCDLHSDHSPSFSSSSSDAPSTSCNGSDDLDRVSTVQFFVRMMSGGRAVVIHANLDDSIQSVHEQIRELTGIPVSEQRLIYCGRQLQPDRTLAKSSIVNDANLHLVGRMRSTIHHRAWKLANATVAAACRLTRGDPGASPSEIRAHVKEFVFICPREVDGGDQSYAHLQVFRHAGVPSALVMLFLSPAKTNRDCAEEAIRIFLTPIVNSLPKIAQMQCASIVLEFCQLLSRTAHDDPLYVSCRSTLGSMLESIGSAHENEVFDCKKEMVVIRDLFPFVDELGRRVSEGLRLMMRSTPCILMHPSDLRDFAAVLLPVRRAIADRVRGWGSFPISLDEGGSKRPCCEDEIEALHALFVDLLEKTDECLKNVGEHLVAKGTVDSEEHRTEWSQYLAVLKELNGISKLYEGAEEKFHSVLRGRKFSLNALIRYAKRSDDHLWVLEHKDVTDFESRRHLVMMLFPDVKDEYEELHEMLIDRSQLLAESFEYIGRAEASALHRGLFMEFKNEEATGPGVLREWFCLVCKAIFNPQNALFLACPSDQRRFCPNPASSVDPLHLDYFAFCGRVIALALMHKVQVGIVFDRVFFQQLSGNIVSLEDIRDADPCLYMSCKQVLEMDVNLLDSDALGLTFVREIEEMGSRRVVELCPEGKDIIVNSRNRQEYVNLLIQHRFVTSISDQVAQFARGFSDILCDSKLQQFFFRSLELEDLDRMLHGSERAICVKDWKVHTEYNGYKEADYQICWFWEVVEGMSAEQQRVLLFFWSSVKYLPVEGFGGLASKLYIFKATDSHDHLPSSHTCFYRLCLPPYPSLSVMRDRLSIITQEHVSSSFGMW